MLGVGCT